MNPAIARQLLDSAEAACRGERNIPPAQAARAAAFLARQALELAVQVALEADIKSPESEKMRCQLACLVGLDKPLADEADRAWSLLSGMCHHTAYELPPTAKEALTTIALVRDFLGHYVPDEGK